jgi:hypothetical protein
MTPTPAASAAVQYAPAQSAIQRNYDSAQALNAQSPPKTYQADFNKLNDTAELLSRAQVLQNNQALALRSPAALQGRERAINNLSGGVEGDDAFLRNAALRSGLYGAAEQGTAGLAGGISPTSAGGVTAEKIYGSKLLDYRNARDQQALQVANGIAPDAAISPSSGVNLQVQSGQQGVQNQNDWNAYLANSRLGSVQNLQGLTQQAMGLTQANNNANANAYNASKAANLSAASTLAGSALGAAGTVGAAVIL